MTAAVQRSKGRGPKYLHDEDCQWAMPLPHISTITANGIVNHVIKP